MGFYDSIDVSASGLTAQRLSMDVIANNIANANTTRTAAGGPFKRQLLVLAEQPDVSAEASGPDSGNTGAGVVVQQITQDNGPDKLVYDPSHPDADPNGFVHMPNVEVVKEMVDMIAASRAYQANVTAIQEARQLDSQTMNILQA
jgi:flagellar basal-body rod protein FlgC